MSDLNTKELTLGEKKEKLDQLYKELDILRDESSEATKTAKLGKENKVIIVRKDGKEDVIEEKFLWDEVRHLGTNTEAYDFLKNKYPDAFTKSDEAIKKANEIDDFSLVHFGIHSDRMTLRDLLKFNDILIAELVAKVESLEKRIEALEKLLNK